jgi:hypothetical protein
MSGAGWTELEALWRDLPERAAPVVVELKRMKRWRWASRALIVGDVVMTAIGLAIGVWMMFHDAAYMVVSGVATIAFVSGAAALSFWARWVTTHTADIPVQAALDLAVKNALIGVRLAIASFWSICFGLLFTAVVAFARTLGEPIAASNMNSMLLAIGATQIWLALILAVTIVYYGQRRADLTRIEQLRDTFRQEI